MSSHQESGPNKGGLPSGGCSAGWAKRCPNAKGKKCRCSCGGLNHGRQMALPMLGLDPAKPGAEMDLRHGVFAFDGLHGFESHCGLNIRIRKDHPPVVVLTELPTNPGTSVTNAAELVATKVFWDLIHPRSRAEDVRWVEHYPGHPGKDETFDQIIFQWDQSRGCYHAPDWKPIKREDVYEAEPIPAHAGPGLLPSL